MSRALGQRRLPSHPDILASMVVVPSWLIGVACAAVALAGCGQSEQERVREVVTDYHHALSERDAKRTCELIGPHAHRGPRGRCLSYVSGRFAESGHVDLSGLEALAESGSIALSGDRATVTRGLVEKIALVRVDGDWKIDKPDDAASAKPSATPPPVPDRGPAGRITAQLSNFYPVFARTRTDDATLELPASTIGAWERRGYILHLDQSRLVARRGNYKAYAFPAAFKQRANPCTLITIGGRPGGMTCGAHLDNPDKPQTSHVTVAGGSVTVAVLPAGVSSARLEMQDGTVETLDLDHGAALIEAPGEPEALLWTDGQGEWSRHVG